jgi:O-antigen/teichoic acid export membrane protein
MALLKLFKSFGIYGISVVFSASIPFLILPFLTKYIVPADYGLVSMFMVCLAFLSPFVGLSVHGALYRFFFDNTKDEIRKYIFSLLIVLFLSGSISGGMLFFLHGLISTHLGLPIFILFFLIPIAILNFTTQILMTYLQVSEVPLQYGFFQIARAASLGTLSVILVIIYQAGWFGMVYALFINNFIFSVLSLVILVRKRAVAPCYRIDYIIDSIKFGLPLIPTALKDSIINIADRIFITTFVGLNATGLYAVGYQLSSVILVVSSALSAAFSPWLFKNLTKNNDGIEVNIVKLTYLLFVFFFILTISWIFVSKYFLVVFFDIGYNSSFDFVPYLSMGFMFSAMHSLVVQYIYYEKKTFVYMFLTMFVLIFNIVLNYIGVKIFGAVGAAYATCFSFFMIFILTWILANRVYPMPWLYFTKTQDHKTFK